MAAGSTYTKIATTTLGSAAASYTFTSIPDTYTDLVLIITHTQSVAGQSARIQFNSDTSSNYSLTEMRGNGSSALSSRTSNNSTNWYAYYSDGSTTVPTVSVINIFNYANTTTYKTFLSRSGAADRATELLVGLWRKTPEKINRIDLSIDASATYSSGSTFTLYGILAA